jgi:tetratricopeptide (TPR) repeat protein
LQIALGALGRYEEAEAALRQMLVIDPLTLVGRWNYAEWLAQSGRVDEAHEMADQLLAQDLAMGYESYIDTSFSYEGKIAEGLSWALKLHREVGRGSGYVMFIFSFVGEYGEARRIADDQIYWVDAFEGRFDEAIRALQRNMHRDPDNKNIIADAAYVLYLAARIDEALLLYERALDFVPEGRPIPGYLPVVQTMRLALARRKGGDEDGAQVAAQIAKQDHAARRAAGRKNQYQHRTEAMIAAFEHDPDRVIAALKSAIQLGLREAQVFDDPMFEDLRNEPRFVALREELDTILEVEHDKVLQLICFNNPVTDDWQPLPETCEGVVERHRL